MQYTLLNVSLVYPVTFRDRRIGDGTHACEASRGQSHHRLRQPGCDHQDIFAGARARGARFDRQRQRARPSAHVVVYYAIALALYMQSSYREVLRCLLEGLQWLMDPALTPRVADHSRISQARTRLGWSRCDS